MQSAQTTHVVRMDKIYLQRSRMVLHMFRAETSAQGGAS
jgi:hypothetical protein